jgi:hypothetical protein
MNSSETVREAIFALLKPASTPLTAAELRVRLRVRALKLAEYEVLHTLRSLRAEGLVRLERGRWSATAPFANASVPGPTAHQPEERHGLYIYGSPTSSVLSPAAPIAWSPNKSRILNHVPQAEEPTHPAAKPVDFSVPWGTFRRLLGYYADCIRNDEGCEVSGFLQDYGERFIFLNQIGTWYPRVGQLWKLSLPSGPHLRSLLRKLTLAGEDGVLVLGYPFQIFTRPDGEDSEGVIVKPIFTALFRFQLTVSTNLWR